MAIFNNDRYLPTVATTVPTCVGHFRIVPASVFRVQTKNTVFMIYPMPYWLFTMVYACVPHFVQHDKNSNFTFFQWYEFGPSAGLTAGLGSVRVRGPSSLGENVTKKYKCSGYQSGTPWTIIYTRWSSWHEGLGCHAPMFISFLSLSDNSSLEANVIKDLISSHLISSYLILSNGNIFRVPGHLYGEFTGHR